MAHQMARRRAESKSFVVCKAGVRYGNCLRFRR